MCRNEAEFSRELTKRLVPYRGCLSSLAFKDEDTRRRHDDNEHLDGWLDPFLPPFEIDHHKLAGSRSRRRLSDKTQVMTGPVNAHTRTRLIHCDEVCDRSYIAAKIMGLNAGLCRAAGYGHDVGHTPYGHRGEVFLSKMTGRTFRHEIFACVLLQHIEREGRGLNLTHQVLQAIRNHSRGSGVMRAVGRAEDRVVMFSDKLAYVLADLSDLEHGRYPGQGIEDYPEIAEAAKLLGEHHWERLMNCMAALVEESADIGNVSFEKSDAARKFAELRKRMYSFYETFNPPTGKEPYLEMVYSGLRDCPVEADPALMFALLNDDDCWQIADIMQMGREITRESLNKLSIGDLLSTIEGKSIDIFQPDLEW